MGEPYSLTDEQMARLVPCFPKSHGTPHVGDRRALSCIVFGNRNRRRWRDADGWPLRFCMTAGQVSDYAGAAALLDDLPEAQQLPGDRGHDADRFGDALEAKRIHPCIPGRRSRNEPIE